MAIKTINVYCDDCGNRGSMCPLHAAAPLLLEACEFSLTHLVHVKSADVQVEFLRSVIKQAQGGRSWFGK